jgi:aminodeoxyfutalosine synthase
MYAVARLFLDNIPHLKAYWVMLGMDVALETLGWGVDDLDGTIDDSTKIYSMAGSMQNPSISSTNLQDLIQNQGFEAVERNSLYELV